MRVGVLSFFVAIFAVSVRADSPEQQHLDEQKCYVDEALRQFSLSNNESCAYFDQAYAELRRKINVTIQTLGVGSHLPTTLSYCETYASAHWAKLRRDNEKRCSDAQKLATYLTSALRDEVPPVLASCKLIQYYEAEVVKCFEYYVQQLQANLDHLEQQVTLDRFTHYGQVRLLNSAALEHPAGLARYQQWLMEMFRDVCAIIKQTDTNYWDAMHCAMRALWTRCMLLVWAMRGIEYEIESDGPLKLDFELKMLDGSEDN